MTPRAWRVAVAVVALTISTGCSTGPRSQPGDPMLDAIRAEEREGDLSSVESQIDYLVAYCQSLGRKSR